MRLSAALKDLAVTAYAFVTSALTVCLLVLAIKFLHFAPQAFSVNFVPVGATVCGFVAASGYQLGFRWHPHRVTWLLMCNAVVLAIVTYFSVYYFDYLTLEIRGTSISRLISFGGYLSLVIVNARTSIYPFALFQGGGNLGAPINYLLMASQCAGFIVGPVTIVRKFYSLPCCHRCDIVLKNPKSGARPSNSLFDLEDLFRQMRTLLAEGRRAEAMQLFCAPNSAPRDAEHKLFFTLWHCDRCPVEFFDMFIKPGGDHVGRARDCSPSPKSRFATSGTESYGTK